MIKKKCIIIHTTQLGEGGGTENQVIYHAAPSAEPVTEDKHGKSEISQAETFLQHLLPT